MTDFDIQMACERIADLYREHRCRISHAEIEPKARNIARTHETSLEDAFEMIEQEILDGRNDEETCQDYRKRRETLKELQETDLMDGPGFVREAYDENVFEGGDIPSFDNWTSSFLWCRECVKWLLARIGQEPVK